MEDIEDLLKTARTRNKELGVTGCLVFHNSCFVQIIEGPKKVVRDLYQDIKRDKRHHNVRLLWEGNIGERDFNDWSLGYFQPAEESADSTDVKQFERNLLLLSELSDSESATVSMFWVGVKKLIQGEGC